MNAETRGLFGILGALLLALGAALFALAWQQGLVGPKSTGVVGRVVFRGEPTPPDPLMVVADADICGKKEIFDELLRVGPGGGIANALVSLVGAPPADAAGTLGRDFVLDQRACVYVPHVLLVPVGVSVRVFNSDPVFHNVHTFSKRNAPVNLSHPAGKEVLELHFSAPEKVQVRCDIHGWMHAWILAVDHPYHALTDAEGRFSITGVPPGAYEMRCWQESLGEQRAQVTIVGGEKATLTFEYGG